MKKFDLKVEKYQILILFIMVAFTVRMWGNLPDTVPVHWGLDGQPDRYDSKTGAALIMPITIFFVYVLMLLVRVFDKKLYEVKDGLKLYDNIRWTLTVFLILLHFTILISMARPEIFFIPIVWIIIGGMFITLGFYMFKASDEALFAISNMKEMFSREGIIKSSRVTSKAMMILGVVVAISGYYNSILAIILLIAGSFALIIVVLVSAQKSS